MKLYLLVVCLLLSFQCSGLMCSSICLPGSCSGITDTTCTNCATDWSFASNTCSLSSSAYVLVGKSADLSGGSSAVTLLPAGTNSCGSYNFNGRFNCNANLQVSVPSGITIPHYAAQVIVWVILLDSTTWTNADMITITYGNSTTKTQLMGNFDGQDNDCNGKTQNYYRLVFDFSHINSTGTAIFVDIINNSSGGSCKWVQTKPCHARCTECSSALNTNCFSCVSTSFLSGNTCQAACLVGYGAVTGTNVCIFCDVKCITCSQNSTYCSSCTTTAPNQAFLLNFTCYNPCPFTYFARTSDHTCASCSSFCLTCSSATICTLCSTNYALINSTCYLDCANGTYANGLVCSNCDLKCNICIGSSTNCTSCTLSGADIAYLYNMTCISTCPDGTYTTLNPNICQSCSTQCSLCYGPLSTSCTACKTNYVLSNTTCSSTCLSLYGLQSNSAICILCSLYCTACAQLADNCSSCVTSGTYESFLDSTTPVYTKCVNPCPAGTFPTTALHECTPCSSICATCDTSANNCFSCKTGDAWFNYTCYTVCPTGYYNDGTNCTVCDSLCIECLSTSVNCSSCISTAYLLVNSCVTACPNTYFNTTASGINICSSCNTACLSCTGATNTTCQTCNSSYSLSGEICDHTCVSGYGISSTTGICILCTSPCAQCYLSDTNCTKCVALPSQYYLFTNGSSSICLMICPSTFFANISSLYCEPCEPFCSACTDQTTCTTCIAPTFFYSASCVTTCPNGTTVVNASICISCDVYCLTCVNLEDNSTSCVKNGTYRSFWLDNVCYINCPFNYYGHTGTNNCQKCHANCLTCTGGNSNQCTSCNTPFLQSGNTCASNCSTGYGRVTVNPTICVRCSNTCKSCSEISTNCSSCQTSGSFAAYLYYDGVTFSKCLITCPNGSIANNATQSCLLCSVGCSLCSVSVTNCSACITGYGLFNKLCYSSCPSAYFLNNGLCVICSPLCISCNGTNSTCSECTVNGTNKAYLYNNTCLKTCLNGYYADGGTGSGPNICLSCTSPCIKCKNSTSTCLSCISGLVLFNYTCLATCPTGQFFSNNTQQCENFTVTMDASIYFSDSLSQKLIVQYDFSQPLDQATFPMNTFQSISFSDPTLNLSMFSIIAEWISSTSYKITISPNFYVYLNNVEVTVTTMIQPATVDKSSSGLPFDSANYNFPLKIKWFLIKGKEMSSLQIGLVEVISAASSKIQQFTTLPGIQQFNKAGLLGMLFPAAQLTTASVLIKSIPSQVSYQGARFWGSFVLFQVPNWQKNKQNTKNVLAPPADDLANNARLIQSSRNTFQVDSIYWRFKRTGFTTFFLYDCYMQMLLIIVSWVLVFIARRLEGKAKLSTISRLYSIFHWLHQITIFYLSLGLVLEFIYFDITSPTRVASMIICIVFNVYYLLYQLYIYYDLIKYPTLQLGSTEFRDIAKKYGYFLKHIRFEEYQAMQDWHPKHFFRPYNYHIVSFYKKYLMIIAVPMFYEYPSFAAGTLILIELFQIIRFTISWPYASKRRNLIRLSLEIIIQIFFITLLLQTVTIQEISKNDTTTIESATDLFLTLGWIGFICIFIFNSAFVVFFIYDICCNITTSNGQEMRSIRRQFFYQKILRYQHQSEQYADSQMLDSWVIKGDLNDKWTQQKETLSKNIQIQIQKYTINKMGVGFTLQIQKNVVIEMNQPNSRVQKQKIKIREQINGTVALTKQVSSNFFQIVEGIYEEYDNKHNTDFLVIKTIAKIQGNKYKTGDVININDQTLVQTVTLQYPWKQKKCNRLAVPMKGFPINPELFNPFILSKMLDKKYLY